MTFLLDMNVSPLWKTALQQQGGFEVFHWAEVGNAEAPDDEIMRFASAKRYVVFTHDLDFGIALARTGAVTPSVVQLRSSDVLPSVIGGHVVEALLQLSPVLQEGALVTIDPKRTRVRILPIRELFVGRLT